MQKLNDVTEEERRVIEELYSARAVPEYKISRVLKDEFGISLSTAKIQRVIFRFSAEVRRKRKAVQKERLSKARRKALEKYGKENKAWTKKLKNPVVVDYNPEVHGSPLWRGEPGHNQNVVKKCTDGRKMRCIVHSHVRRRIDYLCDCVYIRCGDGNIFAKSER